MSRPKERVDKFQTPGPGTYDQSTKNFVSNSKGIILLGRHKEIKSNEDVPGPGSYNIKAKLFDNENTKISFGHGERFKYYTSPGSGKTIKVILHINFFRVKLVAKFTMIYLDHELIQ